jgi:DNA-binding transcriptional LysR family regulator
MDRLDEWRLFVSVATKRSFAKAARAQRRSPQAATRAIAALEQRLGTRLFHRTTRSVTLTADGERLVEQARRALAEIELLERPASSTELRGLVTITAPVLFGQMHVLPVVTELLAAHPGVDARLVLLDRVVSLAEEGIDVAVRIGELPDSALRMRTIGHVREVLCAAPAYLERAGRPRNVEALEKHAFIAWLDGARRVPGHVRLTTSSGAAALDAARAGLGITRALSYQVGSDLDAGTLVQVLPKLESPEIPVQLVQLPAPATRAATAFVDLAYERLKAVLFRRV